VDDRRYAGVLCVLHPAAEGGRVLLSGTGVSHCEMFPQIHTDKPNSLDLFQVWLNLPKRSKHVAPHFKMMWAENAVHYPMPSENGSTAKVNVTTLAGTLPAGKDDLPRRSPPSPPPDSWAADPDNHVAIWAIQLEPGAAWTLPAAGASGLTRSLFFFKGDKLEIGGRVLSEQSDIHLEANTAVEVANPGAAPLELLLLQGRPIDEPVVQHGPFVMNTREEIMEAFMDYQTGKFGEWPWDSDAPVHPKTKGRFALYPDGREEFPPPVSKPETGAAASAGAGAGVGAGAK